MKLVIDRPNLPTEEVDWTLEQATKFHLDAEDIAKMRADGVVWQGDTAFTLEGNE